MRTLVEHEVMFLLDGQEGEVVPTRDGGYARVDGVTVTFPDGRPPRVWAGGIRCRKDGTADKRFRGGKSSTSVDLLDADGWIALARTQI